MGNVNIGAIGGLSTSHQQGAAIAAKTLTAEEDEIVAAVGEGNLPILYECYIYNSDSEVREVTFTDGTISYGPWPIEAGKYLNACYAPIQSGWWFGENAAISATPSADSVLELVYGRVYIKAVSE